VIRWANIAFELRIDRESAESAAHPQAGWRWPPRRRRRKARLSPIAKLVARGRRLVARMERRR
jgi:hypothetical protein